MKGYNFRRRKPSGSYRTISTHKTELRADIARFFYHVFHWFAKTDVRYY